MDLIERARWTAIRQREAGNITAANAIEELIHKSMDKDVTLKGGIPSYKTMAELKAQRGDPAADLYEKYPELRQWQHDRSEWHDETILEIVSEFIEWQRSQ